MQIQFLWLNGAVQRRNYCGVKLNHLQKVKTQIFDAKRTISVDTMSIKESILKKSFPIICRIEINHKSITYVNYYNACIMYSCEDSL